MIRFPYSLPILNKRTFIKCISLRITFCILIAPYILNLNWRSI